MKETISNLLLYSKYHFNQIILQEIVLLIEYAPIIVISIASPSLIYQYYHYTIFQSPFSHYFLFKIQMLIDITKHITITLIITATIILFLSLLGYHLIPYLFKITINETNWKHKYFNSFCSVYYDLFLLRTANFYIIYFYLLLFRYSFSQSSSQGYYYFISLILFILITWYIALVRNHITSNCVILHCENKSISNQIMNYPYDWCFSMNYDIIMLGLKIICCLEAAFFNSIAMPSIQFVLFCFNAIIVVYISIYFFYLCYNTLIFIRLEWFMFNRVFVFLRIGILLFLWYSIIFHLIFLNSSSSNALILSITSMTFVWSIISIAILWKIIIQGSLYNGKLELVKMLFALFTTTNTSLFKVEHYKLINSFELEYSILLKNKASSSKRPLHSFQNPLMLIFMIYNFCNEANSNKCITKSIHHIYRDIVNLIYYSTKGKTLQYFCYYNKIIKKYSAKQKSIIANAHLIVNSFFSNNDSVNVAILSDLLEGSKLENLINATLLSMKEVILSPKGMMKPIIFYNLSDEISKLKSFAISIVNKVELNNNENINDLSTSNLVQASNYCLFIHRYLIETLTQEVLLEDNRLEIGLLKDFLSFHFLNDKTLILSASFGKLDLNEDITLGNIIKCGSEMIKYKHQSVTQIFPQKFRNEGIKLFHQKLIQYVSEDCINLHSNSLINTTSSNRPFEFVINSAVSSYVDLFIYSFKIIPTIINNEMIINGMYSSNDKNIMIFREEDGQLILETFSPLVHNLVIINPEWVEFLSSYNIVITFDELFHKSVIKSSKVAMAQEFECQFSYQIFINLLLAMPHFDDLNQLYSKKYPSLDLKSKLIQAKESNFNVVHLQLFYLFPISEKHKYLVYSIVESKAFKTTRKKVCKIEQCNDNDNDNDDIFNIYQTTSTMNHSSVASTAVSTSELIKKRKTFGSYSSKISETFLKFSNLILLFLCFIIILCIIFLIIQMIQSQSLYKVNNLYYQFKTLQISFSHSFLNIFSNICIAEQKSDACSNAYQDYSKTMQNILNLPSKFSTRDYVVNSISFIINNLQSLYNKYNDNIHKYGDRNLINILLTKMNYIMIRQSDKSISGEAIQITLEEGLQKFINSLTIISQAKEDFDAQIYTVHIITVKSLNPDFTNVLHPILNEIQTEIYKICMNYINYSSGFSSGELMLMNLYNQRENVKKRILYLYISLVLILHIILAILCRWILIIVQKLLTSIIAEIIEELNRQEVNAYLVAKIDILSILNKLYIKDPNHLFKNLASARKDLIKSYEFLKSRKDNPNNSNNHKKKNDNAYEKDHKANENKNLVEQNEMKILLIPVLVKVYCLFITFFACGIIFNVYLLRSFSDVMIINNYVLAHIGLESQLYDNIALPQIMTLVNLTQTDLANELRIENSPDGILNMKIRQGARFKDHIFNEEHNYPSMFPPISSYFNYRCNDMFTLVSDNVTISVGKYLDVDYLYYQIRLCEKFNITSLDNLEFMYNEHNLRSQLLQDYLKTFSYDELYDFNEQFDFFDVFTLTILIIRPLKSYINEKILYKQIDQAFQQFMVIISGYLAFNIVADVLIFLIIKIIVLGKVNSIHLNFLSLNKCFSISKPTTTKS